MKLLENIENLLNFILLFVASAKYPWEMVRARVFLLFLHVPQIPLHLLIIVLRLLTVPLPFTSAAQINTRIVLQHQNAVMVVLQLRIIADQGLQETVNVEFPLKISTVNQVRRKQIHAFNSPESITFADISSLIVHLICC